MPFLDPEKQKQAQHESYLRNKEKVYDKSRKHIQRNRDYVIEHKREKPCADCEVIYPHYVMDLHHRDPNEKKDKNHNIARLISSAGFERLKQEVAKCDILCANCHRERTQQQKNSGLIN